MVFKTFVKTIQKQPNQPLYLTNFKIRITHQHHALIHFVHTLTKQEYFQSNPQEEIYIFLCFTFYHYDRNTIHATAIPNHQAATIRDAWQSTYNTLLSTGHPIMHHILDNEFIFTRSQDSFYKVQNQLQTGTSSRVSRKFL